MELKNKKISLSLLITSIVIIIFFSIIQEKKKVYRLNEYGISVFKRQRVVEFLDITFSFNNSLFYLFISLIVFTISLIYINDEIIIKTLKKLIKKCYDFELSSLWNSFMKKIIISMIVIISILLFIGKCNRAKKANSKENKEVQMDTIAVVDSTAVSSSSINNEPIVTPNDYQDYSEAAILKATLQAEAAQTQIGKAMKGSTLEFEGDIATQGIDTDQLQKVGGDGAQSIDVSYLSSARATPKKK